jgi:hypothetical protein
MPANFEEELKNAVDRVISSASRKKLVVAGPGTGKTTLFRKLLESSKGEKSDRLVLTFLNGLKKELEEKLSDLGEVFTFHGYCHMLLRRHEELREGLTKDFRYLPGLASLIKVDWEFVHRVRAPHLVGLMRDLQDGDETTFYLQRSNYYDAIEFDDSVFRVRKVFAASSALISAYELVLVDEFQDFNRLEASFIELLATKSAIAIVGDDDQALYSQLRGSTHEFIRNLHQGGAYERFDLPFCLRCPEVVVGAVSDIIGAAKKLGKLAGRIDKPYLYYPPRKETDSKLYPKIKAVSVSTQQSNANYFGRYISQAIHQIPADEIKESRADGFPTVLIIGPSHYLRPVAEQLTKDGYRLDVKEDSVPNEFVKDDAHRILHTDPKSNLGWRIALEVDRPRCRRKAIEQSVKDSSPLFDLLPEDYKDPVLEEAKAWSEEIGSAKATEAEDASVPTIKLTSFEGSKGLSAQHVFILGLHEGELPHDAANINDLEICKYIVALTRTRKQCQLLHTWRFGGVPKRPSAFIGWIKPERRELVKVNKDYWSKGAQKKRQVVKDLSCGAVAPKRVDRT